MLVVSCCESTSCISFFPFRNMPSFDNILLWYANIQHVNLGGVVNDMLIKRNIHEMKMYYTKQKPSIVRYRKFKNFCNDSFIKDIELLLSKLCNQQNVPFKILKESVNITLHKHAPLKKRYVRANQSHFMNKKLSKEIMKRSRLRKKFLNTKSDIDRKAYNKQGNYVVSLLRNKNFYSSLDTKVATDNRTFWKTVKPLLSEKVTKHSKINLVEDDKIISRDNQITKKVSEYFTNISILNMPSNGYKCPYSSEQDPILKILDKYKNHPSIKLIKAKNNSQVFKFNQIDIEEVRKSFLSLDPKKAAQKDDIKTNLLKKNIDFFAKYTCDDISDSIRSSKFPNELKQADIVPAHKTSQRRKIIDLLVFSQMFLRFMKDAYTTK